MTTIGRIKSFLSRLRMRLYCRIFGHDWMYEQHDRKIAVKWCAKCRRVEYVIVGDGRERPWIK